MLFGFFILNFYNFWFLNQSLMVFCSSSSSSYIEKVIRNFNFIRLQQGWDLDTLYGFKIAENKYHYYNMTHILSRINEDNFDEKIPRINELIIFRYTEHLKVFRHLLNSFVQLCYSYEDLDSEYFIKCIVKLKETIRKSTKMFLKFVYVVIFLYDVNDYLYKRYKLKLKSIVNQIEILYGLSIKYYPNIQSKNIAKKVLKIVVRLMHNTLDKKTLAELDQINDSTIYYTKNSVNATLVVEHGVDLNNVIVVGTIKKHTRLLNWFYKIAVKDGYYDLGFDKVIVGNTYRRINLEIKGRHRDYTAEHEIDDFNEVAEDAEVDQEEEENEKLQQQRIQQQEERYRKQQRYQQQQRQRHQHQQQHQHHHQQQQQHHHHHHHHQQQQQQQQQYDYGYEVYDDKDYKYGEEEAGDDDEEY